MPRIHIKSQTRELGRSGGQRQPVGLKLLGGFQAGDFVSKHKEEGT